MEHIPCPLCGSGRERHRLLYDYGHYSFKKCKVCGLVMQNPQPVFQDISARYDKEYFEYEIENEESFFSLMMLALADIGFDSLDFPAENKSILDIGCATGRLLYEFKKKGWKTSGVEICTEACEYANTYRNVNIFNCSLEKASFPEKSFTVVHASHLIEHINDPVCFLGEVYRILADNGLFIAVTPNIDSFQSLFFGSGWRSAIADHLFLYSLKTLEKICCKNGFELLKKRTWGGLAKGTAPDLIKRIFDIAAKKTGFGDVMVLLFRKIPGKSITTS